MDKIYQNLKSALIVFLEEKRPELLCEKEFISLRADKAANLYEQLVRQAVDKEEAEREALFILQEGLDSSSK